MANDNCNKDGNECGGSEVFDIERVRKLVALMKDQDLTEIDLRQGQKRIRLRSGHPATVVAAAAPVAAAPGTVPAAAAPPSAGAGSDEEDDATTINSPMVGTFYTAPKPGDPPFVKPGDQVSADTIVCIIEAMKMFNEIPAGVSGKIVSIVARNEDPVDVGRPLFKIIAD